jgi:hypothetical protein
MDRLDLFKFFALGAKLTKVRDLREDSESGFAWFGNNILDSVGRPGVRSGKRGSAAWEDEPRRLWTLRDIMIRFQAFNLAMVVQTIERCHSGYREQSQDGQGGNLIDSEELDGLCRHLRLAHYLCEEIGFAQAKDKIGKSVEYFTRKVLDISSVANELRNVLEVVETETTRVTLLRVPRALKVYVDNPKPFGTAVYDAFPSARDDIKEAGNCLATDCNTAAVFHLMRAVEWGLRALAWDRRVTLPKKRPIELAGWDDIIQQLENAEAAIQQYPKTLAREAQFEFYHGATMQFRRFKNVFRNRIMHSRDDFTATQALGVFENVRDFLQTLSGRISETSRTPVVWKGKKWE